MDAYEAIIEKRLRLKNRKQTVKALNDFFKKGYRYVVRDKESDCLLLFSLKPKKYHDTESWGYKMSDINKKECLPCDFIKNVDVVEIDWKNRTAVSIEEFIENTL